MPLFRAAAAVLLLRMRGGAASVASQAHGIQRAARRSNSTSTLGVAFDIDGVIKQGGRYCLEAAWALCLLEKEGIPDVFLTNGGGGNTEEQYASEMNKKLSGPLDSCSCSPRGAEARAAALKVPPIVREQMILSYSLFPELEQHKGETVLVVGHPADKVKHAAREMGFACEAPKPSDVKTLAMQAVPTSITNLLFATGAAPMEGWNTPASARSATEAAMARRVFGRERRRVDVTPADATTKLSEVKTDAPPPAPEPAAKVRRARRGTAATAAAAAAETTPSRGRGGAASTPNGTPLSQVFRSTKQRNPASAFLTPVSKTKARTAAGASGGGGGTKTPPRRGVRVAAPVRGGAFVGRRISRYWNGERRWFRGTLVEYTAGNGYRVEYDDGDVEEGVEFPDESVRVLPLGSDGAKTR